MLLETHRDSPRRRLQAARATKEVPRCGGHEPQDGWPTTRDNYKKRSRRPFHSIWACNNRSRRIPMASSRKKLPLPACGRPDGASGARRRRSTPLRRLVLRRVDGPVAHAVRAGRGPRAGRGRRPVDPLARESLEDEEDYELEFSGGARVDPAALAGRFAADISALDAATAQLRRAARRRRPTPRRRPTRRRWPRRCSRWSARRGARRGGRTARSHRGRALDAGAAHAAARRGLRPPSTTKHPPSSRRDLGSR